MLSTFRLARSVKQSDNSKLSSSHHGRVTKRSLFSRAAKTPQIKVVSQATEATQARVTFYSEDHSAQLIHSRNLPKIFEEELKGKPGHVTVYYPSNAAADSAPREIFVGLGKRSEMRPKQLRKAANAAISALKSKKLTSATISLPADFDAPPAHSSGPHMASNTPHRITQEDMVNEITLSILNKSYKFDKYITKEDDKLVPFDLIQLEIAPDNDATELQKVADRAAAISRGIEFCRNLGNERADVATPEWYEKKAFELANLFPTKISMEAIHAADLKGLGLNLLMAVGQGAAVEPRLVLLHYNGAPESSEKIALVGKGITFDTGGVNLKPTGYIEDMYIDNAGAATVLGTLQACAELGVKRNLVVALCLAENAISATAVLPSAIIKSYKGLTVEIGNTDAEGRLVLADGLTYVQKHCHPTHVVDVATLTGACVVALGEYAAGLFTNDDEFASQLRNAGEATAEIAWPLPILDEHAEELKGIDSDLKNIGKGRYGGASTAAAFLREFIEKDTKWCHLDIAGPAKARGDKAQGASGFGVHLLVEWLSKGKDTL